MPHSAPIWLTDFPLSMKPDSWDLNPIFLRKLTELQVMWTAFGYEWKFGCELEFTLDTPQHAAKRAEANLGNPDFGLVHPEYGLLKESALRAAAADVPDIYGYALEKIRQNFSANPDIDKLLKDSRWTYEDALTHLHQIENNLYAADSAIVHRARQNIFLAYLHTHSFADGGLMDLVEARFGDYEAGLGWYDMAGPEIRTVVLGTPESMIESYHKFLHILSEQAPRFGLALDLTHSAPPQVHFSLWRKTDGKNMMALADEHAIVFCERALRGYYELMNDAPFLIQDRDYRQNQIRFTFSAGSTREDYVREEDDNWELRRTQYHGITHLARHLMMVMMGTAYGCMYHAAYREFSENQPFLQLERCQHPVIRHRYGAHISGLASVIQHCSIDKDGYLQPHAGMINNYLDRLQDEVGYFNLDDFTVGANIDPDLPFNLRHASTWEVLFKKIKVTADNHLDLSILDQNSEIAEAFAAIEITGRKTVLKADGDHIQTEAHATATALKHFCHSRTGTIFFTPYEQSELTRHYVRQSHAILRDSAQYLVSEIEDVISNPENTHISAAEIAEWFIESRLLAITQDIDINATFLAQILIHGEGQVRMDRDIFLEWGSYIIAIRPHFQAAVEGRIHALKNHPDKAATIAQLDLCLDRALKKPFNIQDRIWNGIESVFTAIGNGSLINHHGLTEDLTQAVESTARIGILISVGLAFRDDNFSKKQIAAEMEALFRTAPAKIENLERYLNIDEKDEITQFLFEICRKGFLNTVTEFRDWACDTMGHGLENRLTGPQKRTGPEQMSGPA